MNNSTCEKCGRKIIRLRIADATGKLTDQDIVLDVDAPVYLVQMLVPKVPEGEYGANPMENAFKVDHANTCGMPQEPARPPDHAA